MIKPLSQLKDVLAAGGNMVIDASTWTMSDLTQLAAEAKNANVELTIKSSGGLTSEQLKQLATAAPGLITFELVPPT